MSIFPTQDSSGPSSTASALDSTVTTAATTASAATAATASTNTFNFPDSLDAQALFDELLPLCRSISGKGYDQSLAILSRYIPFTIEEYPRGSKAFDWTVPPRWELERAVLKDSHGQVLLDSDVSALYVLNYSEPFSGRVSKQELEEHLYSDATRPDLVPYVMSYYKPRWGFCLSHKQRQELLKDDFYEVDIKTRKVQGAIKVGVCELKGKSDRIVQFSSYLCHPNMLNNELSGPIALVYLYQLLRAYPEREYTYRFVINPETIGSICYLSRHFEELKERLEYGVVLTCVASYYANDCQQGPIAPLDLRELNRATQAQAQAQSQDGTDFFKLRQALLAQLRASLNPNYLEIPISFKLSHQSLLDGLHYALQREGELQSQEQDRAKAGTKEATQTESASSCSSTQELEPQLDYANDRVGDVNFANGIFSTERSLTDQERVDLFIRHQHAKFNKYTAATHLLQRHMSAETFIGFAYSQRIDRFVCGLAKTSKHQFTLRPFSLTGSDERQYGSALVNLPVVQASRVTYLVYPEYHSSGDSQDLFSLDSIIDSAITLFYCAQLYEKQDMQPRVSVGCEPQLGKRGLYPDLHSNVEERKQLEQNFLQLDRLLSVLSFSAGSFSFAELCQVLDCSPLELFLLMELIHYHQLVCY